MNSRYTITYFWLKNQLLTIEFQRVITILKVKIEPKMAQKKGQDGLPPSQTKIDREKILFKKLTEPNIIGHGLAFEGNIKEILNLK